MTSPERIGDADRERAAQRLQQACGEGRLTLEEFSDRVGQVWAADDSAAIAVATEGLPAPDSSTPPPRQVGQRDSSLNLAVLGSYVREGRFTVSRRTQVLSLLGEVKLDLRGALFTDDVIEIDVWAVMGNTKVIVPEGVEVELEGFTLLGSRQLRLAAVPRIPGTPLIRLRAYGVLSEVSVRSKR